MKKLFILNTSYLLKRTGVKIAYIKDQLSRLSFAQKKAPDKDGTL